MGTFEGRGPDGCGVFQKQWACTDSGERPGRTQSRCGNPNPVGVGAARAWRAWGVSETVGEGVAGVGAGLILGLWRACTEEEKSLWDPKRLVGVQGLTGGRYSPRPTWDFSLAAYTYIRGGCPLELNVAGHARTSGVWRRVCVSCACERGACWGWEHVSSGPGATRRGTKTPGLL